MMTPEQPERPPECPTERPRRGGRWVMSMTWEDVLFAHWPIDAEAMRAHIPAGMALDTFDGKAWLSIVPFLMTGVRGRCSPALPGARRFAELNVRTYVTVDGVPGLYFFSLDAANRLAVRVARATFALPYFDARMRCKKDAQSWVHYESHRTHIAAPPASFAATYRGTGEPAENGPGTIAFFLTERYALFTFRRDGRIRRGDIAHVPWTLEKAEGRIDRCEMTRSLHLEVDPAQAIWHYAEKVDVRAWWPRVVSTHQRS